MLRTTNTTSAEWLTQGGIQERRRGQEERRGEERRVKEK